jgi:hypothetical protein
MMLYIIAILVGALNALRGSGYLKEKYHWIQWSLKRLIVPGIIALSSWVMSHNWLITLLSVLPYYFVIFTGTGGMMQAQRTQPCTTRDGCKEFILFDPLCDWFASKYYFNNYCQAWGFAYCTLTALVYSLPFIATNYLFALPLFLYPLLVRYANWRLVEFTFTAAYVALMLGSI